MRDVRFVESLDAAIKTAGPGGEPPRAASGNEIQMADRDVGEKLEDPGDKSGIALGQLF